MSLLDYATTTNLIDYSYSLPTTQIQINPNNYYFDSNYNEFPSEAELLCFDPLPPSLFDFDFNFDFDVPIFTPPPPLEYPPVVPTQYSHPSHYYHEDSNINGFSDMCPDYSSNKKQKLIPCDDNNNNNNNNNYYYSSPSPCCQSYTHFCQGSVDSGGGGRGGEKEVTAQSRAARERRRRITEKTQELGKLVPGGTKLNTAHMFEAASKYVKFLQAQLALLNFINSLPQESDKEANSKNLSILGSQLIQEKLYTKGKCLLPMDYVPVLKKHLDSSISKHIDELLMMH